jgi:hypothetical protein
MNALLLTLTSAVEDTKMTKREAIRQNDQADTLASLGFTYAEAESLRRISIRLQHWYEKECGINGGCIERDEQTGKAYWLNANTDSRYPIADLETGAIKRLKTIIADRNDRQIGSALTADNGDDTVYSTVSFYLQTDPRGAALYIIRPGDVPAGADVASYYNRGIVVY